MTVLHAAFAIVVILAGEGRATIEDHCKDISSWDVLKYETIGKQCCDTKLKHVCTSKKDQVCGDVLELQCEVVAWGECTSTPTTIQSKKCQVDFKEYAHQNCEEVQTSIKHTKKIPECKEVSRFNCATDWQVDTEGNKVWSGNETCTPVTWEECEIVEKELVSPTIKTECSTDSNLKWADVVDVSKEFNGFNTTCQVKKTVNCENVSVNKCAPVEWQECRMVPVEECKSVKVHSPAQKKLHRINCLTSEPKITPSESGQNVEPKNIQKKPSDILEAPKITPFEPKIGSSEPDHNVEPKSIEKDLGKTLEALEMSDTPNEPDKIEPVRENELVRGEEILGPERVCFDVCVLGLVPAACFCQEPEGSGGTMCAPQQDCSPSGTCSEIKQG